MNPPFADGVATATPPRYSIAREAIRGAATGLIAVGLGLGLGTLAAALIGESTSPVVVVGSAAIDATPQWLKAFAIDSFGTNDKLVLVGGILGLLLAFAIAVGMVAQVRPALAYLAVAAFGMVGAGAALSRPIARPIDALPSIVAAVGAAAAIALLTGRTRRATAATRTRTSRGPALAPEPASSERAERPVGLSRRRFVGTSVGLLAIATVSGGVGLAKTLGRSSGSGVSIAVPVPGSSAAAMPPGAELTVPGLPPFVTPASVFYRVDTDLLAPVIDPATWQLRVHGLVDRELTLDLPTLLARPTVERDITLTCVSNVVGGPYAGTARWIGIPLRELLAEAGVHAEADQIVARSVDGMTIGTPTAIALDGRDSMLAVAMNGSPLPVEHGFPVRMIVPGLYGYVSACKWLIDLELATFAAFDPYWVQRGWAKQAPIKTMSRIDTPQPFGQLTAGQVAIAGVAWAQHRGISRVEVQVDDNAWADAQLAAVDTIDTWRQWSIPWAAASGRHTLRVRATDATGAVQIGDRTDPFPSGATGWHSVLVTVS